MISKLLSYPEKIFKTFLFQLLSLFLLIGVLLLTINSFTFGISNQYSYINDNELFELFEITDYNDTSYLNKCKKKASQYSALTNNDMIDYYPFISNSIELDFPSSNSSSVIKCSIEFTVCDNLPSFINFYNGSEAEIIIDSNKEEGIYISYDLYEKYQDAYDWTYKYTYYDEEKEEIQEIILPIKGVYEQSDSPNFEHHIYMSISLFSSLLKGIVNSPYNGCIYKFKNSITQSKIDAINRNGILDIDAKIIQINRHIKPFSKIINFSYILLGISSLIIEVSLSSLMIQKNLKNKDVTKIEYIFYKKKKDDILKSIINNFILVLGILLLSYSILFLVSLFVFLFIKTFILPPIILFVFGAITYLIITISDLLSKEVINKMDN